MDLVNKFFDAIQPNKLILIILLGATALFLVMSLLSASVPKLRKNLSIGMFVFALILVLIWKPLTTKFQEVGNFLPGAGQATGGE